MDQVIVSAICVAAVILAFGIRKKLKEKDSQ